MNQVQDAAPITARRCENCGAELLGEHCFNCGQPTKGLVRHFSSILGDFADTVFNVDGRIFRTLGPLLLKPGYLSLEYFAGRRVRYVSPVRLFVFTCLIAFLATRFSVDPGEGSSSGGLINIGNSENFAQARTVDEVERMRDEALAGFDQAIAEGAEVPGLAAGMRSARTAVERAAQQRIEQLRAEGKAAVAEPSSSDAGTAPDAAADARTGEPQKRRAQISFNEQPWDPEHNPVQIGWLPELGNARLNQWIGRALDNSERVKADPRLLTDAFLDALPQTLFVLLPVFALMLKLAYLFKRRLYMEHLIVALHSHAFLSLAILLVALASLAREALGSGAAYTILGVFEAVLFIWMPIYLLVMQKRVYRQGWILTVLKYGLIGTLYAGLISIGLAVTVLLSLVAL
jgi:hypothetical protein